MRPMLLRLLLATLLTHCTVRAAGKPGIVLITVDGLGWGDLSASGQAAVPTPRLDKFLAECAVFRDFHVSPLDAPSRAALLTGLEPMRAGVWGNHSGRHRLRAGLPTIASLFRSQGYATGLMGTWALGDNYPSRPQDNGYSFVLTNPGGAPGGVADFYSNDGTDDLWLLNGETVPRHGSCVEVAFGSAISFIEKNAASFFCHLSPALPVGMPAEKVDAFRKKPGIAQPLRAAWITELDAAIGDLLDNLERLQLTAGTIVILTSTTGPPAAAKGQPAGFNAGRRGNRGGPWEGGHCVPLLIRWPQGGITPGNVAAPAAHFDLLPTLASLSGTALPSGYKSDGISLAPHILPGATAATASERILITDSQEIPVPVAWRQQCIMSGPWRLINGRELYDLRADPGQRNNLAAAQADTVLRLRTAGEAWWNSLAPDKLEPVRTIVGGPQDPVLLTPHDWLARGSAPITRDDVIRGVSANSQWLVQIASEGNYDVLLRRWPLTVERALNESFFTPDKARIRFGTHDETKPVPAGSTGMNFRVALKPGPATLQTWFTGEGKTCGAYFVEIRRAVEVRAAKPVAQ